MVKPGKFIVFEGGEGSGKTTQIRNLAHWLVSRGIPVTPTKQPGGTVLGDSLRTILLNHQNINPIAELLLYQADRAHHVGHIKKSLELGEWVLCDRFTWSTIAYQGAGHSLPLHLIYQLNAISCDRLQPDYTILLDVDPSLGLLRKSEQGEVTKFEKLTIDFHNRVAKAYLNLAVADGFKNCCVLNANRHADDISHLVIAKISEVFDI